MEVPADVTLPTIPGIVANPGGSNLTINNDQVVTIAPGRYQKLHVYSRARVTFTAGRYDFSAVQFEPEVDIVIDSSDGPVEWLVAGNVEFQSSTDFFVDNSLQWGVFSGGDITVRPGVAFPSPLYAPNGTITVFSNSTVNGGLAANNINLQPDITVGTGTINTGWGTPEPPPPSPPAPVCGDDDCTPETGESCSPSSCPQDCGACEVLPSCGDNTCDGDYQESCSTCAADCGACVVTSSCGDSTCDADQSENCSTCESDCGQCVAPLACGDNVCAAGETCSSCALDCGLCPAFETSVFTDTFEITEACNDDQTPLWAGLSWQATTPGDSKVNIYFRSAPTQAELDAAPEVLVGVAAASAGAGGWRYGPPEERAAMERGYQYLNDVNVAEGLPSHNHFGRLRFEIVPTSDGSQSSNLLDISLQSSCETIQ